MTKNPAPKSTVIHTVRNRETGTKISIVQIENATDKYGWSAQCEHGSQLKVNTRRAAHEAGRKPSVWCRTCKSAVTKKVAAPAPAPAKKAPAKKAATPAKKAPAKRAVKKVAAKA